MSRAIPTTIPAQLRAGATLNFQISLADFSAAESWAITYHFRSKDGSAITFTSTASGTDHLVNVPFGTTALWLKGNYSGTAVVSNGTQKFEVWRGRLEILEDIAAAPEGTDLRTQARRTLDNINAVIEGRAGSTILSSSVEGTSLGRIPHTDLLILRDRYAVIVANEERAEDAANGRSPRRAIFSRFTNPQ